MTEDPLQILLNVITSHGCYLHTYTKTKKEIIEGRRDHSYYNRVGNSSYHCAALKRMRRCQNIVSGHQRCFPSLCANKFQKNFRTILVSAISFYTLLLVWCGVHDAATQLCKSQSIQTCILLSLFFFLIFFFLLQFYWRGMSN